MEGRDGNGVRDEEVADRGGGERLSGEGIKE